MAIKNFCDKCETEIELDAESKASTEIHSGTGEVSVRVDINYGRDNLCTKCVWQIAKLACDAEAIESPTQE